MKHLHILFIFICVSCSLNKNESFLDQLKENKNTKIEGSILKSDSIIWGRSLVDIIDNKLIIQNFNIDYAFTIFSIENNILVKEKDLIKKGNGPYEMIYPACFIDQATKNIYFYDINGTNITVYKINNKNLDMHQTSNWTQNHISNIDNYFWSMTGGFAIMNDSSYILLGGTLDKTNMLSIIDQNNKKIIDSNIDFPSDKCRTEIIIKRQIYNNGGIKKRATNNQFLYYCLEGNYAEIISFKNKHKATRKVIINDLPIYTTADNGITPKGNDNNLRGLKAYTTNQYIYIMPYPLRHKDFIGKDNYKGYPIYYNNDIYVFNWNGDFIKSYTLNKLIDTFVVDESDTSLFGITTDENNEYQIIKFPL